MISGTYLTCGILLIIGGQLFKARFLNTATQALCRTVQDRLVPRVADPGGPGGDGPVRSVPVPRTGRDGACLGLQPFKDAGCGAPSR